MKTLKILLSIVAIAVVLLVVAGYFLFSNIDRLAKDAIQTVGSDLLQTGVAVDQVELTLTQGRGEVRGLRVDNLAGYQQPQVFALDQVALQIDPTTLRDPVIVIREILVDGAKLTLEHKGVAETNIKQLLDKLKARAGTSEASDEPGRDLRFRVESLKFTDVSLDVVSPQIETRTLTLPPLERSNLGSPEQGLTPKELGIAVVQPLLDQARDRVEGELRGRVGDKVREVLDKNLSEEDKGKLEQLRSLIR